MTPAEFKEWRTNLGLNQDEAAKALGISRGSVLNYERGSRREDGRPAEIPPSIVRACDSVSIEIAADRDDPALVTGLLRERVLRIADALRPKP